MDTAGVRALDLRECTFSFSTVASPVLTCPLSQIAGGTGITPLAQLLHQKAPLPSKITLLYTSSTPETSLLAHTLPREQLDRLEIHACTSRLSQRQVSQVVGQAQKAGQTQIIVCGPDG